MKVEMPANSGNDARVVRFPPRTLETAPGTRRGGTAPQGSGSTDNQASALTPARSATGPADIGAGDGDDFRHRMWTNAAALLFTVVLTAVGIWLAMSIADLRTTQDCVLMGRRNCAPIATPDV